MLEVFDQWLRLPTVDQQPLTNHVFLVIGALPTQDSLHQHGFGYLEVEHAIQLGFHANQNLSQLVGLRQGARVAVQDEPTPGVLLGQAIPDDLAHGGIVHQISGAHDLLDLFSERCSRGDGLPQHLPGGDGRNVQLLGEQCCLGSLARARGS